MAAGHSYWARSRREPVEAEGGVGRWVLCNCQLCPSPRWYPTLTVMIWALSSAGRQATLAWALKRLWKACMAHAVTSCKGHGVRRGGSALNPLSSYPKAGSALENSALLQLCPICTASLFHSSQASKLSWALLHLHLAFPGSQLAVERV